MVAAEICMFERPILDVIDAKSADVGKVWWFWFTTNAFAVDKRLRHSLRVLPRDPRCKFCNALFRGIGGVIFRSLFGKQQSVLNPRFCNLCEQASREFPGGAEVDMSMLFADVRGSTALSETMSPRGIQPAHQPLLHRHDPVMYRSERRS